MQSRRIGDPDRLLRADRSPVRFSLAQKITLVVGAILLAAAVATAWLVEREMARALRAEFLAKGRAIAYSLVVGVDTIFARDASTIQARVYDFRRIPGVAYVFVADERQTRVVLHTFGSTFPAGLLDATRLQDPLLETVQDLTLPPFGQVMDVAAPIMADEPGVIHVGMSYALIKGAVRAVVLRTLAFFSVGVLVAVGLAALAARLLVRPVTSLVEAARIIGGGNLTHRVDVRRPEELAMLASAMNRMADDLLKSRRELEVYSQTLESRVEERTRELSQAQDQFRQAQKMEAVGRLAGGVAHDFSNLLTAITCYSDLLMSSLAEGDPRRGDLEQVKHAADRAASLTRQLLAFSRRQVLQPRVLDFNAVVGSVDKMLRRLIGEDIDLVTVPAPALGWVKADPGQLEQILMNLAINARDAMPRGGKLTIETANVELDGAYVRQHVAVQPGLYVMLAVSDTGCGMDAEIRSHLFEPFFTTKEVGKGTGLGLATVYGIVTQSGGTVSVYSEPGRGTTFKIYLPRVEDAVGRPVPAASPATPVEGSETILVVEDEEAVRLLTCEVLKRNGYTVLEARHGDEALAVSDRHEGRIAPMLTDMVMPGKKGPDVARQLAAVRRDMKVLYMSGYADNGIVHQGALEPGLAFLAKPFTPSALARKVREVLDAPRDG
jgi:signal transduction histidine kinase/CheY-like chemotaxis protein